MGRKVNVDQANSRMGEERYNTFGSKMVIIDYRSARDVDVYFPQYNWVCNREYSKFKNGSIKCPYEPRHYGVGYLGNEEDVTGSFEYIRWSEMLRRCYDIKYKNHKITYMQCEVCEEWHNFQTFKQWCLNNYYEVPNETMHLDKDILFKGNKIYSPNTCVFVPQNINSLFTKSDKARGDCPIGVSYDKNKNKYCSYCSDGHKKLVHLGYYTTPEDAFYSYKTYKECLIKQIADQYKQFIPLKLYKAMYMYKVEITD